MDIPVVKLPWWARVALKAVVAVLKPVLDEAVGVQLETLITNILLHIIGSDGQMQALVRVSEAVQCVGVACPVDTKGLD